MATVLLLALLAAGCQAGGSQRPAAVPVDADAAVVAAVIDGDTIDVRVDDGSDLPPGVHTVRVLEIDTPETVAPEQPVECGGVEATAFAERLLPIGSTVWLQSDVDLLDDYGRALRYIWTADGTFFNEEAVRQGVARTVLYEPNDRHISRLRQAESQARAAGRGLWGPPCHLDGRADRGDRCAAARAAGIAPMARGDDGYRADLDGDNDGIACE